ncbi:hypothetical protein [Ammoniphilus resinae]|uniref:Uncharacterized protein n=1 Tax=Ammoniphilus resinae TaxID=861532 RepID=A0ABS4GWC6_9BACL|nr:hypothetical protein [Ammoniphilus resinae]MBP1934580.1 hypothetical protein [Ammoniphilus resinae]
MENTHLYEPNLKNTLNRFENRQVVLNFYQEDMLVDRVGLFFDTMEVTDKSVNFQKNGETSYVLDIQDYNSFQALTGFKHYYSFSNDNNRVELYFP